MGALDENPEGECFPSLPCIPCCRLSGKKVPDGRDSQQSLCNSLVKECLELIEDLFCDAFTGSEVITVFQIFDFFLLVLREFFRNVYADFDDSIS